MTVASIALISLVSAAVFVLLRWTGHDASGFAVVLKWSLYATAFACAYAMFVGVYHTFLFVTGLDQERVPRPASVTPIGPSIETQSGRPKR